MIAAKDGATSAYFYIVSDTDTLGRNTYATFGSGVTEEYTYDRAAWHLKTIETGPSGAATIQDLEFTYDEAGTAEPHKSSDQQDRELPVRHA